MSGPAWHAAYWQRLIEGEIVGQVMPLDDEIHRCRLAGMSLRVIGEQIGRRKSYVQKRLLRIAAREGIEE